MKDPGLYQRDLDEAVGERSHRACIPQVLLLSGLPMGSNGSSFRQNDAAKTRRTRTRALTVRFLTPTAVPSHYFGTVHN